ncbi:MAG TPA: DUF4131 domain-containing protein, partial [Planctomycetaceae bacterium]|nr:DUF4131 domain-containing protein [Planctomycetaceae bacterium]
MGVSGMSWTRRDTEDPTAERRAAASQLASEAISSAAASPARPLAAPPAGRVFPAVPVAVSLACGIVVDWVVAVPWDVWMSMAVACWVLWAIAWRAARVRFSAVLLCAACLCVGGARHHQTWSLVRRDDVSLLAREVPEPATLEAVVVSQPQVYVRRNESGARGWPPAVRTVCVVECQAIGPAKARRRVTGRARLHCVGRLPGLQVGDRIVIHGQFARPRPPSNPGQFDFRRYLRRRNIHCLIWADGPEAIRLTGDRSGGWCARLRAHARAMCQAGLERHLSQSGLPVAKALLLGDRTGITEEIRKAFIESGTMHLLAISGLHVGILAMFLWRLARLLRLPPAGLALLVLSGVTAYAFVTDARPPVLRATLLITISLAAVPWYRNALSANSLAVAALVLFFRNPSDLFEAGTQLSFVAVISLLWCVGWLRTTAPTAGLGSKPAEQSDGWHAVRAGLRWLREGYAMSTAVWLFSAPLVAAYFNVVCPVGLVINVLLIPVVILTLGLGFLLVASITVSPALSPVFAVGFDRLLNLLLGVVGLASQWRLGHLYVPDLPSWWVMGFYTLAAGWMLAGRSGWGAGLAKRGIAAWILFGLLCALPWPKSPSSQSLRCTFLDVGHGCAVLVEAPNGRVLLYDAGAFHDPHAAARLIKGALWHEGRSLIDLIVLSHPDADHYNGVPELLDDLWVGKLLITRSFLRLEQPGVRTVCRAAA